MATSCGLCWGRVQPDAARLLRGPAVFSHARHRHKGLETGCPELGGKVGTQRELSVRPDFQQAQKAPLWRHCALLEREGEGGDVTVMLKSDGPDVLPKREMKGPFVRGSLQGHRGGGGVAPCGVSREVAVLPDALWGDLLSFCGSARARRVRTKLPRQNNNDG
ncbi:unnamed protein product [Lampetra planeri]